MHENRVAGANARPAGTLEIAKKAMDGPEFSVTCDVGIGVGTAEILTSDLTLNNLLLWLLSANVSLVLFNLVPAFPLDGGRIIRSLLWAMTRNIRKSTRWAAWLGQAIAWVLIIGGIVMLFGAQVPLVGGGLFNGIWLIFIGAFLNNAAMMGYRQAVLEDRLAATSTRHWRWETDADGLAWLTFDKEGESANTFSREALEGLRFVIQEIKTAAPKGLVIRSAKDNFIAGADVEEFTRFGSPAEAMGFVKLGWDAFQEIRRQADADLDLPTFGHTFLHTTGRADRKRRHVSLRKI